MKNFVRPLLLCITIAAIAVTVSAVLAQSSSAQVAEVCISVVPPPPGSDCGLGGSIGGGGGTGTLGAHCETASGKGFCASDSSGQNTCGAGCSDSSTHGQCSPDGAQCTDGHDGSGASCDEIMQAGGCPQPGGGGFKCVWATDGPACVASDNPNDKCDALSCDNQCQPGTPGCKDNSKCVSDANGKNRRCVASPGSTCGKSCYLQCDPNTDAFCSPNAKCSAALRKCVPNGPGETGNCDQIACGFQCTPGTPGCIGDSACINKQCAAGYLGNNCDQNACTNQCDYITGGPNCQAHSLCINKVCQDGFWGFGCDQKSCSAGGGPGPGPGPGGGGGGGIIPGPGGGGNNQSTCGIINGDPACFMGGGGKQCTVDADCGGGPGGGGGNNQSTCGVLNGQPRCFVGGGGRLCRFDADCGGGGGGGINQATCGIINGQPACFIGGGGGICNFDNDCRGGGGGGGGGINPGPGGGGGINPGPGGGGGGGGGGSGGNDGSTCGTLNGKSACFAGGGGDACTLDADCSGSGGGNTSSDKGTLIVKKDAQGCNSSPDVDDATFYFGLSPTPYTVTVPTQCDSDSGNGSGSGQVDIPVGNYSIQEFTQAFWKSGPKNASCGSGSGGSTDSASFTITKGGTTTCTFQDTGYGNLEIQKIAKTGDDSFNYTITPETTGGKSSNLSVTTSNHEGSKAEQEKSNMTYMIVEAKNPNWNIDNVICHDGDGYEVGKPETITDQNGKKTYTGKVTGVPVDQAQTTTCTFTNSQAPGFLTILKKTTNYNASPYISACNINDINHSLYFSYLIDPGNNIADLCINDYDAAKREGYGSFYQGQIEPGTYEIQEVWPSGWESKTFQCYNQDANGFWTIWNGWPVVGEGKVRGVKIESNKETQCFFTNNFIQSGGGSGSGSNEIPIINRPPSPTSY